MVEVIRIIKSLIYKTLCIIKLLFFIICNKLSMIFIRLLMSKNEIDMNDILNPNEAIKLYELDIFTLGKMADEIRQRYFGKKVFFNSNRHLNPTNECADICKFCGFSAHRKNPNPYTFTQEEALIQAQKQWKWVL